MGTEANDSNLFPLDINDNSLNSNNIQNNVTNANENDEVIIFPIDVSDNIQSKNSATNITNTQSTAPTKNSNNSNGNISKPKNTTVRTNNNNQNKNQQTGQGIPSQKKKSKSSKLKWVVILSLFFYFKKDIFNSRAFHKIENWFSKHNPVGTNLADFENFKKGKPIYYAEHPNADPTHWFKKTNTTFDIYIGELILLEKTGEVKRRYILPKGVKEEMYYSENKNNKTRTKKYIREIGSTDIDEMLLNNDDLSQKALLQEWEGGPTFYVSLNKLEYYQEVGVRFLYNDFDSYKKNDTGIIFIPGYFYELIQKGDSVRNLKLKDIPTFKIQKNAGKTSQLNSQISEDEVNNNSNSEEVIGLTSGRNLYKVSSSLGKSFFYYSPDYTSKTKKYIVSGDWVQIEKTENGFGFTHFYNKDEVQTDGWLDLSTLEFECNDCDIKR